MKSGRIAVAAGNISPDQEVVEQALRAEELHVREDESGHAPRAQA